MFEELPGPKICHNLLCVELCDYCFPGINFLNVWLNNPCIETRMSGYCSTGCTIQSGHNQYFSLYQYQVNISLTLLLHGLARIMDNIIENINTVRMGWNFMSATLSLSQISLN